MNELLEEIVNAREQCIAMLDAAEEVICGSIIDSKILLCNAHDPHAHLEGIGVVLHADANGLFIANVLEETPAQRGGIVQGDRLLKIDGMLTQNLAPAEANVQGPAGTTVKLLISRKEQKEPVEIVLQRAVIRQYPDWKPNFSYMIIGLGRKTSCKYWLFGPRRMATYFYRRYDNYLIYNDGSRKLWGVYAKPITKKDLLQEIEEKGDWGIFLKDNSDLLETIRQTCIFGKKPSGKLEISNWD